MYRRILLLLALALPLVACEDASSPDGTTSMITVRAYVDANGTGLFDAGDLAVSGQGITLRGNASGATLNATTDAQGLASFANVAPGSYSASFTGTAPAGAVLATAETATLVAPFDGADVSGEFRFVFQPGSISGVLFRDNNGNGAFDVGIDLPAPGLLVELFAGVPPMGEAIAETATSAAGAFSFGGLRPGLYTVVLHPLPTMDILEGDTIPVTVGADVELPMPLAFTGNLIQTILQVRGEANSSAVAFEGVVTAPVGVFSASTTGNQFNVQDGTAGVLVLNTPLVGGPQLGDSVRVVGTKDVSAGEVVIRNPTITLLGSNRTVPAPRPRTAAQVVASNASDPVQGSLVSVGDVVVDSVQGGTSVGYNVYVRDVGGTSPFIVRVGVDSVVVRRSFWTVGGHYDITGTLAAFNAPQVKLRFPSDVEARSTASPIGVVRAAAFADSAGTRGDTVTIEGVVHTAQGVFGSTSAYIQDPSGGMLLFNLPAGAGLAVGDSVRVTGTITWFSGELEVAGLAGGVPVIVEDLGTAAIPVPRTISGAQFLSRAYEGQLVRLGNVVADSIGTVSGSGGYTVWVVTTDGQRVQVRINATAIGIPVDSWTVGATYDVVGALSRFGGSTTQLKPRGAADVTAGSAGVISIAEAEAQATGDTVVVEGVVTVPEQLFGTLNAYIQDGTGGIQVFGIDTANVNLAIGELVRVRGVRGAFSGELQISRFSSAAPLELTRLGNSVPPLPRVVTGAEILARTYEGELVALPSVTVVSIGAGTTAYNVVVETDDGSQVTLRNDRAAVGVPVDFWVVGAEYDVIGVPTAFNSAPQVKFRGTFDVVRK